METWIWLKNYTQAVKVSMVISSLFYVSLAIAGETIFCHANCQLIISSRLLKVWRWVADPLLGAHQLPARAHLYLFDANFPLLSSNSLYSIRDNPIVEFFKIDTLVFFCVGCFNDLFSTRFKSFAIEEKRTFQ